MGFEYLLYKGDIRDIAQIPGPFGTIYYTTHVKMKTIKKIKTSGAKIMMLEAYKLLSLIIVGYSEKMPEHLSQNFDESFLVTVLCKATGPPFTKNWNLREPDIIALPLIC